MPGREATPDADHHDTAVDEARPAQTKAPVGGNRELAAMLAEAGSAAPPAPPPLSGNLAAAGNRALAGLVRRSAGPEPASADPPEGFRQAVGAAGAGQAVPDGLRSEAETAFGADFSSVRVHTGDAAAEAAKQAGARAFTVGSDIYLGGGAGGAGGDRHLLDVHLRPQTHFLMPPYR
ncbi:DUF4157 domain-containing protein, partial [Actinoplanes sp. NPDC051633]|uniref:eCIS core domain-containing protein n=1 Tax=Actinoplanes sp. NPDC051633 TaxID=3155670 RepID=UPI0034361588